MPRYLLDTNIFIQAKNRHYGLDFCPAFWEWLIMQNRAGSVASIKEVYDELSEVHDDLFEWAQQCGSRFFMPSGEGILDAHKGWVGHWARTGNHAPRAVREFLDGADSFLVAHALVNQFSIVTYESRAVYPKNQNIKQIKIPNACEQFNIKSIRPDEMLRREGARFVLGDAGRGPPA